MRFIDSNIIAYAFYKNERQDNCQHIIREGGTTNSLALIEAFNIIEAETERDVAARSVKALLKSNIDIVPVDINLVFEALKRTAQYPRLRFLDLVHYTTALLNNCGAVVSYDRDFDGLELPREEQITH